MWRDKESEDEGTLVERVSNEERDRGKRWRDWRKAEQEAMNTGNVKTTENGAWKELHDVIN